MLEEERKKGEENRGGKQRRKTGEENSEGKQSKEMEGKMKGEEEDRSRKL